MSHDIVKNTKICGLLLITFHVHLYDQLAKHPKDVPFWFLDKLLNTAGIAAK